MNFHRYLQPLLQEVGEHLVRVDSQGFGHIEKLDDIHPPLADFDARYLRLRGLQPRSEFVLRQFRGFARCDQGRAKSAVTGTSERFQDGGSQL
jgi:hypothetical protein